MLGFVVVHLAGNLLAFAGSGTFNTYARSLRDAGAPVVGEGALLWLARVVLAGALALHLAAHAYLLRESTSSLSELPTGAREPSPASAQYSPMPPWYATLPLGWLLATGGVIAVFVVFHIAQLTIGATHPAFVPADPYHNMVVALGFWPVSIAYIAAAAALGAHLLPGMWTGMRSLGLIRPGSRARADELSVVVPLLLVIGMAAVPLAVLTGVLR
jgi:succinate dehydrogenase / fumarate reductase cytochrome b subunit